MNASYYVENILEAVKLPFAEEKMPLQWVFQQDNDPKRTSKKAKEWFRTHNISVMESPAQSPDFNPIEHLWMDVKHGIRGTRPKISEQQWEVAGNTWETYHSSDAAPL